MRTLTLVMLVSIVTAPLAGCLVRTDRHHHRNNAPAARRGKDCPPSYHWIGYRCEHNGRAKGHRK